MTTNDFDGDIIDGNIIVAASLSNDSTALYRYTTSGVLDSTFGTGGLVSESFGSVTESWVGIAHTWDGKIVVSGYGGNDFAAARYNAGVGLDQRVYVQQDANWNVTSISNASGATVERYRLTPYGTRKVMTKSCGRPVSLVSHGPQLLVITRSVPLMLILNWSKLIVRRRRG